MTVQELIDIAKEYNPDAEVRIAMRPWISSVDKIKPCVDMDTNMVNMTICVEDKNESTRKES